MHSEDEPGGTRRSALSKTEISEPLSKRLMAYAAAAAAASAGLLATAPADAKVVFTRADTRIFETTHVYIDLNHDGKTDFELVNWLYSSARSLRVNGLRGNGIVLGANDRAAALASGAMVGSSLTFEKGLLMARNSYGGCVPHAPQGKA